jgi:hypothetical protein
MSGKGFGHRLCVGWIFWYTRHVPFAQAVERRDELMSDLWEHHADAARMGAGHVAHQLAIVRRMIAGMPADLSWRRSTKTSREQALVLAVGGRSGSAENPRSKRWICRMIGHRDRLFPYPGSGKSGGYYMLCRRCARVHADDISDEALERTHNKVRTPPGGFWGTT